MLVLSRKLNQEIVIGDNVTIRILKIKGNTIRLGIDAPRDIKIVRGELPAEVEVEIPTDSNPTVNDNTLDCSADVTVVFGKDHHPKEPSIESVTSDVIPFRTAAKQADSRPQSEMKLNPQQPTNRLNQDFRGQQPPKTVRFRQQLPKTLQHNRLKELVKELTDKNCPSND